MSYLLRPPIARGILACVIATLIVIGVVAVIRRLAG